jgi:hypothetical protein
MFFLLLCLLIILWRVEGVFWGLPANFSPTMALALAGGLWVRNTWSAVVLFFSLLVADVFVNLRYGCEPLTIMTFLSLVCYGASWWAGKHLGANVSLGGMICSTVGASLVFYVVTNTASWALSEGYAKTPNGLLQALTVGLPGYPPTWQFFTNSLFGDITFMCLIRFFREIFSGDHKMAKAHRFLSGLKG